jgi:hypothetical protein
MSKKLNLLPLVIIICILLSLNTSVANADKFTNAYLRLNNQAANSSINATLCAQPSSASTGLENKTTITFPDSFIVNTSISSWTTDTSNLPDNSTAWPGISVHATAVSGKSVTFTSSDLTSDTLYCFNIISSLSNTGITRADSYGTIATKDSSNTTIDSTTFGVTVMANNQVSVTATVGPQISDIPISITSDSGSDISSNTTIGYTIIYANNTVEPIPLTIQAQWSQGVVEGSQEPSVDILDYVVGSATNAYNSTSPVIDTVNKTITWNITNFPGKTTNQTVTFKLKTNENYTGNSKVKFDVSARAICGWTVTPDEVITQYYHYNHPENTVTATPTTITPELTFTNTSIISLSQSSAQITISTSKDALLTLKYGTSPNSLTNIIRTLNNAKDNIIKLANLEPNTSYYFKITATDSGDSSKTITTDIFTFKTAIISPIPSINTNTIIVTSKDNILLNSLAPEGAALKTNIIIIPTQSVFSLQFSLDKPISLKTVQAIIRNKKVMGFATTDKQETGSNYVNLVEIQPGIYTGKLTSPAPGIYEIYIRMLDLNGNILEQKIADLLVTKRFRILTNDNNPIENARVLLSIYNQTSKIYSVVSSQILPIENPSFTAPDGSLNLVLPSGTYRAEISAIGYASKTIDFEINPNTGGYPTVYLKKDAFGIFNFINYYSQIASDTITASQTYLKDHANSSRLFDIVTTGSMFIFVIITLVAFSAKTHVSLLFIPYFLLYKLRMMVKKEDPLLIVGKVIDDITKLPVTKATVYLQNPQTGHVEVTLKTNKLGEFYYQEKKDRKYQIYVMKKGIITPAPLLHQNKGKQQPVVIQVRKLEEEKYVLLDAIIVYFEDILGMFLEFLIVIGFIFEFYFIATFGLLRIAPFVLISGFTFVLLLVYVYKPGRIK